MRTEPRICHPPWGPCTTVVSAPFSRSIHSVSHWPTWQRGAFGSTVDVVVVVAVSDAVLHATRNEHIPNDSERYMFIGFVSVVSII